MSGRLRGKTAVVTGAARGIGRSVALCLAEEEAAALVVCDVNDEQLRDTADEIAKIGTPVLGVRCDVSSAPDVQRLVGATVDRFGGVDVLINNAAWHQPALAADELDEDTFLRAVRVGLIGSWLCAKTAFPHLAARRGAIVNVTSNAALLGQELFLSHAATKAGIIGLTYTLAREWGPYGIRVNAVFPSARTMAVEEFSESKRQWQKNRDLPVTVDSSNVSGIRSPLGDGLPDPDDVAPVFAFLASDDARNLTGQVIGADRGKVMH